MTTFDLRSLHLRSGEQAERAVEIEIEPFSLGGARYCTPGPAVPARLTVTRASSGLVFRLELATELGGPCHRCLEDAAIALAIDSTEYQDARHGADEELRTDYLADDRLDLSAWSRDALAVELPEQILCRGDCAGLCAQCGRNRNEASCECKPPPPDQRLAGLAELRDRLTG